MNNKVSNPGISPTLDEASSGRRCDFADATVWSISSSLTDLFGLFKVTDEVGLLSRATALWANAQIATQLKMTDTTPDSKIAPQTLVAAKQKHTSGTYA